MGAILRTRSDTRPTKTVEALAAERSRVLHVEGPSQAGLVPIRERRTIAFVSTNWAGPWGGSELLWSEAALRLVARGHTVAANVYAWPTPAPQLQMLRQAGIGIEERRFASNLGPSWLQKLAGATIRAGAPRRLGRWLSGLHADLICLSIGSPDDDEALMSVCTTQKIPYVIIVQANREELWPNEQDARIWIDIFSRARRVCFVSQGNRALLESQLGIALPNAEVVRNPFNVRYDAKVPWPESGEPVKLACVGRLDPGAKGQDLLLQLMASDRWRTRPVQISLFGSGGGEDGLRRLSQRLGISERVRFCGHVGNVEAIWATHHGLVLPSRYEGLPLALVEAMLCARPVIVTDVAGNAELVEHGVTGFVAEAPTLRHLDDAMDQAWQARDDWQRMGQRAAIAARDLVPPDPAATFGEALVRLAAAEDDASFCGLTKPSRV